MTSVQDTRMIRKDNRLIEAQYRLSVHQQRVVYTLLEMIHPADDDLMPYTISISDMAERFGLEKSNAIYAQMQEAISDLVVKKLVITEGADTVVMAWLSQARYRKGQGTVEISFHKDLKPYLLHLKSYFTQYNIASVIRFKSSYSIRFYELLKMNEYLGRGGRFYRDFSLQSLRVLLQIGDEKYQNFKDLRVFVIETAVKEVNDYSDISIVSVKYIKTGRAVTDVKIIAEPKNESKIEPAKLIEPDTSYPSSETLLSLGVSDGMLSKWIKKFGKDCVIRNVSYALKMQQEGKVTNPLAYLSKAIQDDYATQAESQRQTELDRASQKKQVEMAAQEHVRQQMDREQQKFDAVTHLFESLDEQEQNAILDQVAGRLKSLDSARFAVARSARNAHREPFYRTHFKAALQESGHVLEN